MGQHYASVFPDEQKQELIDLEAGNSLFEVVEAWLERTPFLQFKGFHFLEQYSGAVKRMLERESEGIKASDYLESKTKEMRPAYARLFRDLFQINFGKRRA